MDKEKSLYDEIFMTNEAPNIKDTNSNKDIKDAIDGANLNETVGMEDIFVFEDDKKPAKEEEKKFNKEKKALKEDIKLEDAKFFDLVNNTLVDLRLDLDKVDLGNELNSMKESAKDMVSQEVKETVEAPTLKEAKAEEAVVNNITLEDFQNSNKTETAPKNIEVTAPLDNPSETKRGGFTWLSYVLVVLLVLVAIGGSLTFLVHQFK